jgi:hypothetical protein
MVFFITHMFRLLQAEVGTGGLGVFFTDGDVLKVIVDDVNVRDIRIGVCGGEEGIVQFLLGYFRRKDVCNFYWGSFFFLE